MINWFTIILIFHDLAVIVAEYYKKKDERLVFITECL